LVGASLPRVSEFFPGSFKPAFEVVDPFHADGFVRVACQPNGGGRVVGQVERAIAFGAGGFRR